MQCAWDNALLRRVQHLPSELLEIIRNGSNDDYLSHISRTALDPRYTCILFAYCRPLFAHICASAPQSGDLTNAIACIARVISRAPYLTQYATKLLAHGASDFSRVVSVNETVQRLLALFRLLRCDHRTFSPYLKLAGIKPLLAHENSVVRYLTIRILQIRLQGADAWFEDMLKTHLGPDEPDQPLDGAFDHLVIDYRFLTLWENQWNQDLDVWLEEASKEQLDPGYVRSTRTIPEHYFDQSTVLLGGILFPRLRVGDTSQRQSEKELVPTATTSLNLRKLAKALTTSHPVLVAGAAGSGKSSLIQCVASRFGIADNVVTLHLNEQTDFKLLVGLYSTGSSPGTFQWNPGVLTQAVREGRWVFIEDLDRAPNEIVSALLPLIERRELIIPSRKETVLAHPNFRILATVCTHVNHRGDYNQPLTGMVGMRHWQQVLISPLPLDEQADIVSISYPALEKLQQQLTAIYSRLLALCQQSTGLKQGAIGVLRPVGLKDMLKWCHRISHNLQATRDFTSTSLDGIFLEAIDCFAGALPSCSLRDNIAAIAAQELNLDPQRRDYLLNDREVTHQSSQQCVVCGRYKLSRALSSKKQLSNNTSFSINAHSSRTLERVTAAVYNREPLLLVGETGVGKTTAVQYLAAQLGKRLVPFNLSQQSEVGDLLGGFKPVSARSVITPLHDEFHELFLASFSNTKNRQFLELLAKNVAKGNWKAVVKLWKQALGMVEEERLQTSSRPSTPASANGDQPAKRRKVSTMDYIRWDAFAASLQDVERRIASSKNTESGAFAFSFVEGRIVEAVRRGDWVLLDEINLASPDTLEGLLSLLDTSCPSILLAERGDVKRIEAAKDFRLFAAMNPATDVGKRDLPPGIRDRFTELYVDSPDDDARSLQSIVRAYLPQHTASDPSLPVDVTNLYQQLIALANSNKLVDGAGSKPQYSLRTLTRMLSFGKNLVSRSQCSIRRGLYEGCCMSFLTLLNAESVESVAALVQASCFGKGSGVQAELRRPLKCPTRVDSEYMQPFAASKHWVRKGPFSCEEQPEYIITPFVRGNLENLVRASSTQQFPVLLQGPTSSGKTSMVNYLAKRTGHKCVRINNHEFTDIQEYLGTYVSDDNGKLAFQEGVLVQALREGSWIILDELNLAPTDVLEALNRLLDDNRELLLPETGETVRPSKGFMLFATQNPAGLYGGRKVLSRAFRNRFLELHFDDIPVDELQTILHQRALLPESRCRRIVQVYRELSVLRSEGHVFEQKSFATLRDLFRWAGRPNETIEQLAQNGFMLLAERVRKQEERAVLKEIINRVMSANGPKVEINEDQLYSSAAPDIDHYRRNAQNQQMVWTTSMRRLYILVRRAIANNEPVLLVGETGCGKTTVVQILADALQQDLAIVNAHQNTESGDLVGSQRPVRNRGAVENELRQLLISSPLVQSKGPGDLISMSTDQLLQVYDSAMAASNEAIRALSSDHQDSLKLQAMRLRHKALFEWADGSLVQAMRTGSLFLLDEISLADDSVLERINSVLEPSRAILLAEKGAMDGASVTAATGFQFFATMNPGGDYGKRELSPALRNRFTEIWVPPLHNLEDVLQIVRARLPSTSAPYAKPMVAFAAWFKDRYNTSATASAMSIRDALSWVDFMNASPQLDVVSAVVHGAALTYIDALGANPAGLMALTGQNVESERDACLDKLGQLLGADANAIYRADVHVDLSLLKFQIGPFELPFRRTNAHLVQLRFNFEPPTTRSNTLRVARALQLLKPILLEGNPGVGKTALVAAVATACNVPLTRINLSEQTDLLDLFGSDVPVVNDTPGLFEWRDAPFLRALKSGGWVLLDEMNLASQSVLEGLNACLDHRGEIFVPEIGMRFQRHPGFRLFAAQNPHHQGSGRKGLPASFVNRFTVVYADAFRPEDLMLIGQKEFPQCDRSVIQQAITFVQQLDDKASHGHGFGVSGGPWEFNLRDINRLLHLSTSSAGLLRVGTPSDHINLLFVQRFRNATDREFVETLQKRVLHDAAPETDMVWGLSSRALQVGLGLLQRDPLFASPPRKAPSLLRSTSGLNILQSIMLCVQQRWPVILSGPSGAGKTAVIETLASLIGAKTVTFAMNADTDTMDLIGGYEQGSRSQSAVAAKSHLLEKIRVLAKTEMSSLRNGNACRAFDLLTKTDSDEVLTDEESRLIVDLLPSDQAVEAHRMLESAFGASFLVDRARFDWIDGILVNSLQQGDWLILDNANLCSASVLDRLNSLLEPNGVLFVSENPEDDGRLRMIQPHKNFRIFLTLDPKYGELSRAMRNRAVELHMLAPHEDMVLTGIDPSQTENAIARLGHASVLHLAEGKSLNVATHKEVFRDHLTSSDLRLASRFERQIRLGLFRTASDSTSVLPTSHEVDFVAGRHYHDELKQLYRDAAAQCEVPADFASIQTLHPLNNQPLVQQSSELLSRSFYLTSMHEMALLVRHMHRCVAELASSYAHTARVVRSERQLLDVFSPSQAKHSNSVLLGFLQSFCVVLRDCGELGEKLDDSQVPMLNITLTMLRSFWNIILSSMWQDTINVAQIKATLSAGLDLFKQVRRTNLALLMPFMEQIELLMKGLLKAEDAQWGLACTTLWRSMRPPAPASKKELDLMGKLETFSKRFDSVTQQFQQPVQDLSELRLSFARALHLAQEDDVESERLLFQLQKLLPENEATNKPGPHFRRSFEHLYMHFGALYSIGWSDVPLDILQEMGLLALRPVLSTVGFKMQRARPDIILHSLSEFIPEHDADMNDPSARDKLLPQVLHLLCNRQSVSLEHFNLLREEAESLGRAIASNAQDLVPVPEELYHEMLKQNLWAVLGALQHDGAKADLRTAAHSIMTNLINPANAESDVLRQKDGPIHSSWPVAALASVANCFKTPSSFDRSHLPRLGAAWTNFGIACLGLYLPQTSFDPALKPRVVRDIYLESKQTLSSKLMILRAFNEGLTGNATSLRCRWVEQQLDLLGAEPLVDHVYRPHVSETSQLQADFDLVRREIDSVRRNGDISFAPNSAWLNNLIRVRERLLNGYAAYKDFTGLAIAFIDCIRIGQHLSRQTADIRPLASQHALAQVTPFAGASLHSYFSDATFLNVIGKSRSLEERLHWFQALSLRCNITPLSDSSAALREAVNSELGRLYETWRRELNQEQRNQARKSSLYRYQGQSTDEEDVVNDMEALFPTFEDDQASTPQPLADPTQDLAPRIVSLHAVLFDTSNGPQPGPVQVLESLADCWASSSSSLSSPGEMLPATIHMLGQLQRDINGEKLREKYNIYSDSDFEQVGRVLGIVAKTKARFTKLHEVWPEHATPVDVLRVCDRIQSCNHSDPPMKLMPIIEKLLATIAEWQKVASREYSAANALDEVIELIVGWRRLELSTWAGLLDAEQRQCEKQTASWWFVAFESVIAASLSADAAGNALLEHTQSLLSTLEQFLRDCGLGEFGLRLRLLRNFEAHLLCLIIDRPNLAVISNGLANFISYYSRFEGAVSQALAEGRAALEKQVKEVIQLTSWKDRNVEVLRQSAKGAHKKLARLIRKYRALLAQPVTTLAIGAIMEDARAVPIASLPDNYEIGQVSHVLAARLSHFNAWTKRPQRFVNVSSTVRRMFRTSSSLLQSPGSAESVQSFLAGLKGNITELQKSTPATMTDENKGLVNHLKTRKRRLLADVLKHVRGMGFRAQLSQDVLSSQASSSVILATIPHISKGSSSNHIEAATSALDQLLSIIPDVRRNQHQHSDEITAAEAMRCSLSLESIFSVCISQRKKIGRQLDTLDTLKRYLRDVELFAKAVEPEIVVKRGSAARGQNKESLHQLEILVLLTVVTADLIQTQGTLSTNDVTDVVRELRSASEQLKALLVRRPPLTSSEISLTDAGYGAWSREIDTATMKLANDMEDWKRRHPELGPTLDQLKLWTAREHQILPPHSLPHRASYGMEQWMHDLLSCCNFVLIAMEHIDLFQTRVVDTNDEQSPKDEFEQIEQLLTQLQIPKISKRVNNLVGRLPGLDAAEHGILPAIAAACKSLLPVLVTFATTVDRLSEKLLNLHATTALLGVELSRHFISLAHNGFCSPPENEHGSKQNAGEVEEGTGLGEGEGAEDISKDVGDEEDLSEVAQGASKMQQGENMEAEKDAVDMADDELEGELDEAEVESEKAEGNSEDDNEELDEDRMDTEIGEVDDLGDSAVDEKMWEGGKDDEDRNKDTDQSKGSKDEQDMSANNAEKAKERNDASADADAEEQPREDEHEQIGNEEAEQLDTHAAEEKNLDLPQELNMEGNLSDAVDESDISSDEDEEGVADVMDQDMTDNKSDVPSESDAYQSQREDTEGAETSKDDFGDPEPGSESEEVSEDVMQAPNDSTRTELDDATASAQDGHGPDQNEGNTGKDSQAPAAAQDTPTDDDPEDDTAAAGTDHGSGRETGAEQETSHDKPTSPATDALRRLGDALERWHRRQKDIKSHEEGGTDQRESVPQQTDLAMRDAAFEHVGDDAEADTQAIGTSSAHQSMPIDEEKGLDDIDNMSDPPSERETADAGPNTAEYTIDQSEPGNVAETSTYDNNEKRAFIGERMDYGDDPGHNASTSSTDDELDGVDNKLSNTHISHERDEIESLEVARRAWAEHAGNTRNLSLALTEQLRLILHPTQATRMRGDFRTGKRLNIKRIIPYIASSFKRDKIWMRRSVPSKRSYQIMLAIDDSQSMAESESKSLAFETLALVAKSLSMLEVGELCVVGFGEAVEVAQDFTTTFSEETGAQCLKHFQFAQTKTNVRRLLAESIELFRAARLKASGSASDLWQLQLIISDGVCEDHPSIQQLVRQAQEERIMIVFIVVDAVAQQPMATGAPKQSILDLTTAEFNKDASGEMQLQMVKYLDTFPFRYYLIVRDVQELPSVLAAALRQWFAEVTDTSV